MNLFFSNVVLQYAYYLCYQPEMHQSNSTTNEMQNRKQLQKNKPMFGPKSFLANVEWHNILLCPAC